MLVFVFAYFRVSKKRNIKRSPNGIKPSERDFRNEHDPEDLNPTSRHQPGRHDVGGRAYPPRACPPPSWAPCCSTDVLLPPIYTYVPPNDQNRSQKPNFAAATFCIHEIPSWGLFRSSAGGGIDHGGLLHQHHSLFDDV